MLKVVISVIVSVCMAHTLYAKEAAQELGGFYVGSALVVEAVPKHEDNGVGLLIKAGKKLDAVMKNLGVEAEMTASLMDPEFNGKKADILTLATYVTYDIEVPKIPLTVRPRFGVIAPNLGDNESVHSRNLGLSTGLLAAYRITPHVSLFIDYTNLGEKVNNYGLGAEFNF